MAEFFPVVIYNSKRKPVSHCQIIMTKPIKFYDTKIFNEIKIKTFCWNKYFYVAAFLKLLIIKQ